ncbi:MAG: sodium:solute symporter family protein [Desulfovibrio sp.]
MLIKSIVAAIYLIAVFVLGYKGFKETKSGSDYMLAGRSMNPFVMAMSYGATFISTSAIIGFGGVAALFGFSLMWLVFLNIFVGVFIAMVFFGKRTRRMGLALNSQTFPELLGKRYQSPFIQKFIGIIIFLFVPLYAAAVLIGICRMLEVGMGLDFNTSLIGFTLLLALYVITGGLKAVMYTDAFQGAIMLVMMIILAAMTYMKLGGFIPAHEALANMAHLVPEKLQAGGMVGWTQSPKFGSPIWLTVYTTIIYGVGVGVLAQPQLVVRFMTVARDRELNRAVLYGGLFILFIPGVPYIVGALSNVVFFEEFGKISIQMAQGNIDKIIPLFIEKIMPNWYSALFLMGMMAAAMSTLSSQYHVGGTSLGRDFLGQTDMGRKMDSLYASRLGVSVTIVVTLVWAFTLPGSVIARATAFFFGLCAAAFLPAYLLGIYWKGMTRAGAIASLVGGFSMSMLWLLFVHLKEAKAIGLCQLLTGQETLVSHFPKGDWPWLLQYVDPNVAALPLSFLLAFVVSRMSTKLDKKHVDLCWSNMPNK